MKKLRRNYRLHLEKDIGRFYRTRCTICGSADAHVKYFLWVKVKKCSSCGKAIDLFPGYLLAANVRHPKNVFVCSACGELSEVDDRRNPGSCRFCSARLVESGPAGRNHCECRYCGVVNSFPSPEAGPPDHRLFAIEYHCMKCKSSHTGRFFKKPDERDLSLVQEAETQLSKIRPKFVPGDEIPAGDETDRLHRWGYRRYSEMFNSRQLLGLELSARLISGIAPERVKNALATNLSDLLRYQNMLCRYDSVALKSLDIFSVHGFPVGLIQCESNFLGIMDKNKKICIGSGGWANIIEKFRKAKAYCDNPFEVRHTKSGKEIVPIKGEWIGDRLNGNGSCSRKIEILCADAASVDMEAASLDAVFTDPPYFGNVQYAELMDFCYVWLRRLVGASSPAFANPSTRNAEELTGNVNMGRDINHFTEGLSKVFQRMAKALKPGRPLVFTYHHNDIKAYIPIAVAILDAGLTCSASLPCPAEMGASIHISGTGSSIIDTVFVCRSTGVVPRHWLTETPAGVAALVKSDMEKLRRGNVQPTQGDLRCICIRASYQAGHLVLTERAGTRREELKHAFQSLSFGCSNLEDGQRSVRISMGRSRRTKKRNFSWFGKNLLPMERNMPKYPFEVVLDEILQDPDQYVDAVFSCLESEFLTMPRGTGFVDYPLFERGYEALKSATSGFDQTPDFIIPSEFNPQVIIEAKITEDDGTARDKVTRIQHLGELSMAGQPKENPKYEVIACIGGRGFGVRREDMKKMIIATRGKVFTLKTLDQMVEHTELKNFLTIRWVKT